MTAAVDIDQLHFSYPDGHQVLKGIDLHIQAGESVGLIGPNGAGKTTLLLHLNGLLCGSGHIRIFGMPMQKGNLKRIREKVGLLFQDPDDQLFSTTVFDDVAFGPVNMGLSPDEVRQRSREALRQVGMEALAQKIPFHLSLGEKKRIAIATILSMKPELIVLDEPTSNLDPRQRKNLINLLKEIHVTKIIASHDLAMVGQLCNRVVILNAGAIVWDGIATIALTDENLMNANGLETVPA